MASTISPSSRFDYLRVVFSVAPGWISLGVVDIDGDIFTWSFGLRRPDIISGSQSETDLEALQDLWASSDGLRDGDGNAFLASYKGAAGVFADPSDMDTLRTRIGLFNPLRAGDYERWKNKLMVEGALVQGAAVEVDAATGRTDIVTTGGIRFKRGVPVNGEVLASLGDWQVENVSGYLGVRIRLVLRAPSGTDWPTPDEVVLDHRFRAFIYWMQGIKTAGPDIYTGDIDDVTEESDLTLINGGHRFTFDQNIGTNTSLLTFRIIQTSYGSTRASIIISTISGVTTAAMNVELLTEYFDATNVTVPTELASDIPPLNDPDDPVPVYVERVKFSRADLLEVEEKPTWRSSAGMTTIGGAYGRVIRSSELRVVDNGLATEHRVIPWDDHAKMYNVQSIHCDDAAAYARRIRLPDPRDAVPQQGETLDIAFQNDLDSDPVFIEDKDGVELLTLLVDERASLRLIWDADDSEEIRSTQPIPRHFEVVGSGASGENDYGDVNYFTNGATRYRPTPIPAADNRSVSFMHADTFELAGVDTFSDDAAISNLYLPQSVKMLKAGTIHLEFEVAIRSGSSGSLANGHGVALIHNGSILTPEIIYRTMGSNDQRTWWLVREMEVAADDIITPMFRYPDHSSMPPSNVQIAQYRLRIDMNYEIKVEV